MCGIIATHDSIKMPTFRTTIVRTIFDQCQKNNILTYVNVFIDRYIYTDIERERVGMVWTRFTQSSSVAPRMLGIPILKPFWPNMGHIQKPGSDLIQNRGSRILPPPQLSCSWFLNSLATARACARSSRQLLIWSHRMGVIVIGYFWIDGFCGMLSVENKDTKWSCFPS